MFEHSYQYAVLMFWQVAWQRIASSSTGEHGVHLRINSTKVRFDAAASVFYQQPDGMRSLTAGVEDASSSFTGKHFAHLQISSDKIRPRDAGS